jgi:hypothetical protein
VIGFVHDERHPQEGILRRLAGIPSVKRQQS